MAVSVFGRWITDRELVRGQRPARSGRLPTSPPTCHPGVLSSYLYACMHIVPLCWQGDEDEEAGLFEQYQARVSGVFHAYSLA